MTVDYRRSPHDHQAAQRTASLRCGRKLTAHELERWRAVVKDHRELRVRDLQSVHLPTLRFRSCAMTADSPSVNTKMTARDFSAATGTFAQTSHNLWRISSPT